MKLSLKQKFFAKNVDNPETAKASELGHTADNTVEKNAGAGTTVAGKIATAAAAQHKKPRRVPRPHPQHATPLDTADDDNYDDCWLPEYEDPRPTDKLVDDGWVSVKKPVSGR
ncbi:hypothetical protein CI238_09857 [Colletotrichum incanum]|uniref:Uncharacterized protein n=1 Tax=Colletotrichum incanum TaxID=1573173 RepID=A0A167BBA8_COLIC|nr:hypothetical protein CI238_09857 [Colletotrichum incanum]OHW93964.1 hypothetical protein CSPAE12_07402 [Colletotrichum incanum]